MKRRREQWCVEDLCQPPGWIASGRSKSEGHSSMLDALERRPEMPDRGFGPVQSSNSECTGKEARRRLEVLGRMPRRPERGFMCVVKEDMSLVGVRGEGVGQWPMMWAWPALRLNKRLDYHHYFSVLGGH